jgi:8-oxo-dGTP diphosphatase
MRSIMASYDALMFLRLPKAILGIGYEVARHLLRRPVVGIAAICRGDDDRILLIRRGDTGTWALPGGTAEWGEPLSKTLARELLEETGVEEFTVERTVGIWSRPDRDPRFHAITVVVVCKVKPPIKPPVNSLEIRDVRFFQEAEIPGPLAMTGDDFLMAARTSERCFLE